MASWSTLYLKCHPVTDTLQEQLQLHTAIYCKTQSATLHEDLSSLEKTEVAPVFQKILLFNHIVQHAACL